MADGDPGDPPDWEQFFEDEGPALLGWVRRRYSGSRGTEPEDVVQDVLTRLLDQALNPIENLAAYAYRALANRLTDLFRGQDRATLSLDELEDTLSGQALDRLLVDHDRGPEDQALRRETRDEVRRAIARLPAAQRAVLVATEIEGRPFAELAEAWDEPLGTLLSRKHRAVQALKKALRTSQEGVNHATT